VDFGDCFRFYVLNKRKTLPNIRRALLLPRRDPRTAFCVCLPADLTASPEEPMKYSFAGALASVLLLGIAADVITSSK
jgi:hypothetical protein